MRRYLQFSIRSLLILTTLAAVLCAWGVPAAKRYAVQRERERLAAEQRDRDRELEAATELPDDFILARGSVIVTTYITDEQGEVRAETKRHGLTRDGRILWATPAP